LLVVSCFSLLAYDWQSPSQLASALQRKASKCTLSPTIGRRNQPRHYRCRVVAFTLLIRAKR